MKIITETDFLPHFRDIQYDLYQLLYGALINRREGQVYDTVITLCRRHREKVLRQAKIEHWIDAVSAVIDKLKFFAEKEGEYLVVIPYLPLRCKPQRLFQIYSFQKAVLENVGGLEMKELVRIDGKEVGDISDFYPLPSMDKILNNAVPMLEAQYSDRLTELNTTAEAIIDGLVKGERIPEIYSQVFLQGSEGSLFETIDKDEPIKPIESSLSRVEDVGVIYYMLCHFMKKAHGENNAKRFQQNLENAARTIAWGLFKPDKKMDRSKSSRSTLYQYVKYRRFDDKADTLDYIEKVLENCGIEKPKELKEARSK